jgi:hypothetical protein
VADECVEPRRWPGDGDLREAFDALPPPAPAEERAANLKVAGGFLDHLNQLARAHRRNEAAESAATSLY